MTELSKETLESFSQIHKNLLDLGDAVSEELKRHKGVVLLDKPKDKPKDSTKLIKCLLIGGKFHGEVEELDGEFKTITIYDHETKSEICYHRKHAVLFGVTYTIASSEYGTCEPTDDQWDELTSLICTKLKNK